MISTTRRPRVGRFAAGTAVAALAATAVLVSAAPANAAAYSPTDSASLIQAITDSNTFGGADVITLTGTGFTLAGDLPPITSDLTILGPGSGTFTLDGDGLYEAFFTDGLGGNTSLAISGVTVTGTPGPAVAVWDVDLQLTDVALETRGLVFTNGNLTLSEVSVSSTLGDGATIDVGGTNEVLIEDSEFQSLGGHGIQLDASGDSIVNLDTVLADGSVGDGLNAQLYSLAALTAIDVTTTNNNGAGVYLDATDTAVAEFTGLDSRTNAGDGALIYTASTASVRLTDSTLSANLEDGLDVEALGTSQVVANDTTAAGNLGNGLELSAVGSDTAVAIYGGQVSNSGDEGVSAAVIDGGQIVLQSLVATGSQGTGLGVTGLGTGGNVVVVQSTLSGNGNPGNIGGGIRLTESDGVALYIFSSTISGNEAAVGGGVFAALGTGSTLLMENSTISGNSAADYAGLYAEWDGGDPIVHITHTTITANTTTGTSAAAYIEDDLTATIAHTIIAGNAAASDLDVHGIPTIDYSLIQSATAISLDDIDNGTGNIYGLAAGLGALADNGGPTRTHLPLTSSPAVDAGEVGIVPVHDEDQRGFSRIVGVIDMGAVEVQPILAATGANVTGLLIAGGVLVLAGAALAVIAALRRKAARG